MAEDAARYALRGVSAGKAAVHQAIKHLDPGLYPGAFCKIHPDFLTHDPSRCVVMHSDGAGTKVAMAYLAWKHGFITPRQFARVVIDSLVMNLDDCGCVGALGPFGINLDINRNAATIPDELVDALINLCQEFCEKLTQLGIDCHLLSGETADVGDLTRTATVGNTVIISMKRVDVIDASNMRPGDALIGFSSTGQANWEDAPNSSIGDNGLTSARHDCLRPDYREDAETYAPETPIEMVYCGEHSLDDSLPGDPCFTIAEALLSPTRTYLPLIKALFENIPRQYIHGLIHCSGGGQTKIGKFGPDTNCYEKTKLFPVPPIFQLLARYTPAREMQATYNMGHRLEASVDTAMVEDILAISASCGIEAKVIGQVTHDETLIKPMVKIYTAEDCYTYQPLLQKA